MKFRVRRRKSRQCKEERCSGQGEGVRRKVRNREDAGREEGGDGLAAVEVCLKLLFEDFIFVVEVLCALEEFRKST
jgi:hypothetical protein